MSFTRAFSLIEILLVMVLLALLAGAVTLSLSGRARQAQLKDVQGQLEQFDYQGRQFAIRHGRPFQMVFDLDHGVLRRISPQENQGIWGELVLPEGFHVEGLLVADNPPITSGKTALWCSDRGQTASYGLKLSGPDGKRCSIVAGLSGQFTQVDDAQQIQSTLALLSKGNDAR